MRFQVNPCGRARRARNSPPARRRLHQRLDDLLALRVLGVEGDRTLVVVQHREIEAVHVWDVAQLPARDIADAGPFHLDHVGAEPGQKLRAGRARLHVGEVENANAVERLAVAAQGVEGLRAGGARIFRLARSNFFSPAALTSILARIFVATASPGVDFPSGLGDAFALAIAFPPLGTSLTTPIEIARRAGRCQATPSASSFVHCLILGTRRIVVGIDPDVDQCWHARLGRRRPRSSAGRSFGSRTSSPYPPSISANIENGTSPSLLPTLPRFSPYLAIWP